MKTLIVTTSADTLPPNHRTGLWLEEFAVPFTTLTDAGVEIVVASPKGGSVPLDPKTEPDEKDRQKWAGALNALSTTKQLSEVTADGFDAVFFPGGHGPLVDLRDNPELQRLIESFDREGKLIAAVCHGPAALLNARNTSGEPLIKGRKVTGFTNMEERLVMLHSVVPFLLEDAMKERGGDFDSALVPMISHVVRDGNLITGQNPGSSQKIADELLDALRGPSGNTQHA